MPRPRQKPCARSAHMRERGIIGQPVSVTFVRVHSFKGIAGLSPPCCAASQWLPAPSCRRSQACVPALLQNVHVEATLTVLPGPLLRQDPGHDALFADRARPGRRRLGAQSRVRAAPPEAQNLTLGIRAAPPDAKRRRRMVAVKLEVRIPHLPGHQRQSRADQPADRQLRRIRPLAD